MLLRIATNKYDQAIAELEKLANSSNYNHLIPASIDGKDRNHFLVAGISFNYKGGTNVEVKVNKFSWSKFKFDNLTKDSKFMQLGFDKLIVIHNPMLEMKPFVEGGSQVVIEEPKEEVQAPYGKTKASMLDFAKEHEIDLDETLKVADMRSVLDAWIEENA